MKKLFIDLETRSPVDIKTSGAYKYAEQSEILLFGYAYDDGPVSFISFREGTPFIDLMPQSLVSDLTDPGVLKIAHNAPFERANIYEALGVPCDPEQWFCTAVLCASAGYPLSLENAGEALNLFTKKDLAGSDLIKYFCIPCKPTKANGGRTWNLPEHDLVKWESFIDYLITDVEVCRLIYKELSWVEITETERKLWILDQHINDRGVKVDIELAKKAIELNNIFMESMKNEAKELTGLENPSSVKQLGAWIAEREGIAIKSLDKDHVSKLLKTVKDPIVKRVLIIRQETAKSSNKKYEAMINAASDRDHRIRGLLQFCGANRTHRWAGRLLQIQNLPRISLKNADLDICRELVKAGDLEMLEICYDAPPVTLSQLIRTALIAEDGKRFLPSDFSAIEARVIAWLANEKWRLEVFEKGGDIYIESASRMFGIPSSDIPKTSPLRQQGKVAELACGFQGGESAIERMDSKGAIPKDKYGDIVDDWRQASPNIVKLWKALQKAAMSAITSSNKITVRIDGEPCKGLAFSMDHGALLMHLPSGRALHYPGAFIKYYIKTFEDKETGNTYEREVPVIHFMGINQETRKWEVQSTYGGKLAENATQAIARDCLANAMLNLDEIGYKIVGHVHDEVIPEMPLGKGSIAEVNKVICKKAAWMEGLPLNSEGFETLYYKKDDE